MIYLPQFTRQLSSRLIRNLTHSMIASGLIMTMTSQAQNSSSQAEITAFKNEIILEINKQRKSYAEDLKKLQDQRESFVHDLQTYSLVIKDLQNQVIALQTRVTQLESDTQVLKKENKENIESLRNRIQIESQNRQNAVSTVIKEVTSELDKRTTTPSPSGSTDNYRIYTVEKGDTLGAIAKAFNLSLSQLKTINQLDSDTIIVGQKLKVPPLP